MLNIYILNAVFLILTMLAFSGSRALSNPTSSETSRLISNKESFALYFWSILLWIEFSFRGNASTDYHHYEMWFDRFKNESIKNVLNYDEVEKGFALLNFAIGKISKNFQVFLFVSGAIAIICLAYSIGKLSDSKWPTFLVFIGTGLFYGGFNLMSQFLAGCIFFVAVVSIHEGKFKKYLFWIIISAFIHKSAIVMLPLYFVLRRENAKKHDAYKIMIYGLIAFIMTFIIGGVSKRLSSLLYQDNYIQYDKGGYGLSYIIKCISLVVIIIYFTGLFDFEQLKDRMAYWGSFLYGCVILWSSSFLMIQRFSYYLIIFPMMAISLIIEKTKNRKQVLLILCIYFFIMQIGRFSQTMNI